MKNSKFIKYDIKNGTSYKTLTMYVWHRILAPCIKLMIMRKTASLFNKPFENEKQLAPHTSTLQEMGSIPMEQLHRGISSFFASKLQCSLAMLASETY